VGVVFSLFLWQTMEVFTVTKLNRILRPLESNFVLSGWKVKSPIFGSRNPACYFTLRTKQPKSAPWYSVALGLGNYHRPSISKRYVNSYAMPVERYQPGANSVVLLLSWPKGIGALQKLWTIKGTIAERGTLCRK